MTRMLDLRCPVDRRRMFGRIRFSDASGITAENLIEFACDRCRKLTDADQVLHRFDFAGVLIETIEVPREST